MTDRTVTIYTHILDLAKEVEPPADGKVSKLIFEDDRIKAVVFAFRQDQGLSEHTAAKPAMLFFVKARQPWDSVKTCRKHKLERGLTCLRT